MVGERLETTAALAQRDAYGPPRQPALVARFSVCRNGWDYGCNGARASIGGCGGYR